MESSKHWSDDDFYKWFYEIQTSSWYDYSQNRDLTNHNERQLLYQLAKHAERGTQPSVKQLKWAKNIVDRFIIQHKPKIIIRKRKGKKTKVIMNTNAINESLHATVRMAWHDNSWNGKVCADPENNKYCVGDYSLLSNRLRRRRRLDIECAKKCKGQTPNIKLMDGYIPPCYWSINAFGPHQIEVEHEHPMKESNYDIQTTPNIPEKLPPFSLFTWPFKLSFMRDDNPLSKTDGKYPKNLVPRIERFFSKLTESESILFLYCNYDNPISADDYKYLLVGCGILKDKGELHHYDIPKKNLENILKGNGYQNFPTVGWDFRLSLDETCCIRLPYHEYLKDAETYNDFTLLDEIKVVIDEPELIPSFKFVAMDIDDDKTIYLLTKIQKSLLKVKEHNRYTDVYDIDSKLDIAERLQKHCWQKRGHLPGFKKLNNIIFERQDELNPVRLNQIFDSLFKSNKDKYVDEILNLLENPESSPLKNDELLDEIEDLVGYLNLKKITPRDFLKLSMLNLTTYQFQRILKGILGEQKRTLKEICANPYLIYEEYEAIEENEPYLGERIDGPINLFEIDISYFPDTKYLKRFRKLQNMRPEDPHRIRALTISYLNSLEGNGDCFEIPKKIEDAISEYPLFYKSEYALPEEVLSDPDDELIDHFEQKLVIKEDRDKLFYYLKHIYDKEQFITKCINNLLNMSVLKAKYKTNIDDSIKVLKSKFGKTFDEISYRKEREYLFSNIFNKRFFVLSDSPGSGKSYELLRVVDKLQNVGEDCLILTPTGKAALRLSSNEEKFENIHAMTIDKFLYENKDKETINIENVIIDEMSMVDLQKFYALLSKFNFKSSSFKRLILVGDEHQLPPIGFGKVYVDIINFILRNNKYKSNYCSLETNCRQFLDDTIISFSKIFSGQNKHHEPLIQMISEDKLKTKGLRVFYWKNPDELQAKIVDRFKELFANSMTSDDLNLALNRIFNLDDYGLVDNKNKDFFNMLKIDNFQVLTPYRAGFYGSIGLNDFFQKTFRSEAKFIDKKRFSFKHSDKIIQIKNNYKKGKLLLSNGSMGIVEQKGIFYFNECKKPLYSGSLNDEELELAYTITVHKAQGSGFEEVFFILPPKKGLLFRELLYTALTRSKKSLSVFVYGEPGQKLQDNLFEVTRKRTSVELRKTSLLENPYWDYTLSPVKDVNVRSRAEYIIFKKLQEFQDLFKDEQPFYFDYEKELKPANSSVRIKPDFTIMASSGQTYYLEHLGLLSDYSYERNWYKRLKIFEKDDLLNQLITTDEMTGIKDSSIEKVIEDIILETIKSTDSKFSKHHYSLG